MTMGRMTIAGKTYTTEVDGDLRLLTSPRGARYVAMATFRGSDEYIVINLTRHGRGLGKITWKDES